MSVRVAINGFGRTGRAAFRAAYESGADIEWAAINDVADPAMLAHLLKYDTVYGRFPGTVTAADGAILVDGNEIMTPIERTRRHCHGPPWASTSSSNRQVAFGAGLRRRSISQPVRRR